MILASPTDSALYLMESSNQANGAYIAGRMERTGLSLGVPESRKLITGIRPRFSSGSGATVYISVGSSEDVYGAYSWTAPQAFVIGTDYKIDVLKELDAYARAMDPRVVQVSATLAAAFGLGLYAWRGGAWPERARGAVGHYMTFGGQLALYVTLAVAVLALERARAWRLTALAAALTGAVALAATFTRSAWLGLAAALATLLGLARPRWLPALAVALALGLALAPPSYRARAWSAFDPDDPTNLQRTCMWRSGLTMFRDHPLTGVGPGGMKEIYDRYMLPGATERAGHLHSVPVHLLASMGAVGLAAFLLLYGSLFVCAAGGGAAAAGGSGAALRLGVTALLVGFLVTGLFEWNFGDEELLYPLFTLAGMAWAARDWGGGGSGPGPRR